MGTNVFRRLAGGFLALAAVALLAATARAELGFGYNLSGLGGAGGKLDLSRQGQFFATSDFGDRNNDWESLTRAQAITRPGAFPSYNRPWIGDGSPALFGVSFPNPLKPNWPEQFDRFQNKTPLFDHAVVQWGENPPAKGGWAACLRLPDGKLKRLEVDADKPVYPFDRSSVRFEPTPLKAFYVGLRDGKGNSAEVKDINLFIAPDANKAITNDMFAWLPGFYLAVFSSETPGMIEGLAPVNFLSASHHSLYYHGERAFDLLFRMTPFVRLNGVKHFPAKEDAQVRTESSERVDIAEYPLSFDIPGVGNIKLEAKSVFRQSADKSLEVELRADKLPPGVQLGYQFSGPAEVFGRAADAASSLSGDPVFLSTAAGDLKIHLQGANAVTLEKETGACSAFRSVPGEVRFEAVASGDELTVGFSLPVGFAGRPQPEALNYTWRPSLADGGDPGIAPFKQSDLELLDEINCGDPNDPHPCFDVSNDPAIPALRKQYGGKLAERGGQENRYGYLAFLDNPKAGASPITTVNGHPCRDLEGRFGRYFRYNLKAELKPRTPYLVVVEHAFDKLRRGEFHTIYVDKDNHFLGFFLPGGGFETSGKPEGKFKTEAVLCYGVSKRGAANAVSSIVFSDVYSDGASRDEAAGLAVKSVKVYRVKTMPALPDIDPLRPAPERRRHVLCLSELCSFPNPLWVFQYPRLVGYDGIWTYNDQMSRFLGGSSSMPRAFQPGTLAGNELLFDAAEKAGVAVNLHLGELLNLGFGNGDDDSFTGSFHGSYNGESVPFNPTSAELDHIAGALSKSLAALAKYSSLREISLADNIQPPCVWTARNLRDFRDDTGVDIKVSPLYIENVHALLAAGPETLRKWKEWAGAGRFKFHQWLLDEVRKHRPDLSLVLGRCWYHGSITPYDSGEPVAGVTKERMVTAGINNYLDYLGFMGIDPGRYAGQPGFSMELEVDNRIKPKEKQLPPFYGTDWFQRIKDDFKAGGLSIMLNQCYDEYSKPFYAYTTIFVKGDGKYRQGLVDALLGANARNITLPTYDEPWAGRIDALREFAVPYRLLPYAEPTDYEGKLADSAKQAVIKRYGDRYGLVNNGGNATTVDLELPPGKTSVTDLSNGVRQELKAIRNGNGFSVKVPMKPWSLKTLEIQ